MDLTGRFAHIETFMFEIQERERRRQHMALVKSLEVRKKHEEREKRRLEVKAEKMASREKRIEQRRIEMDLLSEIRKPVEDMELPGITKDVFVFEYLSMKFLP